MSNFPSRQIHLDFHTAPAIDGVGTAFDPQQFIKTLRDAHVNSVSLFAKCHHGHYYYPSKLGKMHPGLKFDLLGAQIEACKQAGIRTVAYTTYCWSEAQAVPELQEVSPEGILGHKGPKEAGYFTWQKICMNHPEFTDLIIAEMQEQHQRYQPDGIFVDILRQTRCHCPNCLQEMQEMGLDPDSLPDVKRHDMMVTAREIKRLYNACKEISPEMTIYFNVLSHLTFVTDEEEEFGIDKMKNYFTHVEIDPILGYNSYLLNVNYLSSLDTELLAHSARFHTCWGDMGSLRNPEMIEMECMSMLTYGCKCLIGDHLSPAGTLDDAAYGRIAKMFAQLKAKEPYCLESKKQAEIGVLLDNVSSYIEPYKPYRDLNCLKQFDGAVRMLVELHQPFNLIDSFQDFQRYRVLVLPDTIRLNSRVAEKLRAYLKQGGKVIASDQSGLWKETDTFALEEFGIAFQAPAVYSPYYLCPGDTLLHDEIERFPYAMNHGGCDITVTSGDAQILAKVGVPYFNRTARQFSGHCQTPFKEETEDAAIVKNGNVIYIKHPIFSDYKVHGRRINRSIFKKCLDMLLPDPLFQSETLPATAEVGIRTLGEKTVVHLMHYQQTVPFLEYTTVDAIIPLYHQQIGVKLERMPKNVCLAPSLEPLAFEYDGQYARVTVPEINGHQMILFE